MKTCCDCHQSLPLTSFVAKAPGRYEPRCRRCRSIKYNKSTPELLCKKIYLSQVTHSATRNHPLPEYSKQELKEWVLAQPGFGAMYSAWQESNYKKDLAPSVDRKDDNLPYTLNNLQLMVWHANRSKGAQAKKENTLLVNHRPVIAYNPDGTVHKKYLSMAEAMREFGQLGSSSFGISSVCNGIPIKDGRGHLYTPRTYKGFVWKWADEE